MSDDIDRELALRMRYLLHSKVIRAPTVTKEEAQAAYGEIDDMKLSNEFAYMNWFMDHEETIIKLLKDAGAE
jgi:hypothetical protein